MMRYDVTTKEWVIFAPGRIHRPHEVASEAESADQNKTLKTCPFCPGNEHLTPPEIDAYREKGAADSPGWRVRVIPNKFPALRIEENNCSVSEGLSFRYRGGCGAHEVLIESPEHDRFLGHQQPEQIEMLLRMMQARFRSLLRDPRFQSIIIFKNHGLQAGTSLPHPHCQLIATPVVPHMLRFKHAVAAEYFDMTGNCIYCVQRDDEEAEGKRILVANDHYVAFLPYASHVPFEIWIAPRIHHSSFGLVPPEHFKPLSLILKEVLSKLYHGLGNPAFNLTIDTAPRGDEDKEYFLWHVQIHPRLTTPAGFELGSGMSINTVLPEEATAYLKEVPLPTSADVVERREQEKVTEQAV